MLAMRSTTRLVEKNLRQEVRTDVEKNRVKKRIYLISSLIYLYITE